MDQRSMDYECNQAILRIAHAAYNSLISDSYRFPCCTMVHTWNIGSATKLGTYRRLSYTGIRGGGIISRDRIRKEAV